MRHTGFAHTTIERHRQVLAHLQPFLNRYDMDFSSECSIEILEKFRAECHLRYGASVINVLERYLSYEENEPHLRYGKKREPLPKLYEDYIKHYCLINPIKERTLRHTRKVLHDFYCFLSDSQVSLENLKIEPIDAFLAECHARYQSETVKKIRSSIRGFLRYLHMNLGILKKDMAKLIVAAPVFCRNNPPKFLRRGELQQVFDQPHTDDASLLTRAMIYLAYCTGLRPSEISRMTLDDIFFAEGQIIIPVRKGRNPVQFSLPDETIKAIAAYIIGVRPNTDERRLFLNVHPPHLPLSGDKVGRMITRYIQKVHPEATAYWLRHSYAQSLLEGGASLFEIKEMLGHDNFKSTSRYIHIHTPLMRKVLFDETV